MVLIMGCNAEQTTVNPMVLVQNERAFAAATAEKGMRDGFLEFIADDGILFVPGAINGREHYEASPQRPGLLTWQPIYAEISSSGDLGYTTGPWEWRAETMADTPEVSGHYNTIWKLQPDSTWKFVIDIGVAHDPHQAVPPPLTLKVLQRSDDAESVNYDEARSELVQAEYTFSSASATEGLVAAYVSRICNDVRYYRMGEFPIQGVSAVTTALGLVDGTWTWEPNHADVSRNGDFGYTYGVSTLAVGDTVSRFSYAHIWRKSESGVWQLTLDIHIPLPPPSTPVEEETGG